MAYTELKEKLEKLLNDDLSNRSTLQDARRNLFLNSEGAKVQQQIISEKQGEISSLNLLVEKKKTILQLKDEQIASINQRISELEKQIASSESGFSSERNTLLEKIAALENQVSAGSISENKLSELSLQNEEFSAKIRELIYHIDSQNSEVENLKLEITGKSNLIDAKNTEIDSLQKQVADNSRLEETAQLLEEKIQENKNIQERADLLFASEQQLKMLVASQNNDIEALTKITHGFKKQTEDIAAGWQIQQDQLIMDNANLLAELSLLKESIAAAQAASVSAEELNTLKTINEDLTAELELTKEDLAGKLESISSELESLKAEKEALGQVNINLFSENTQLKEAAAVQNNEITDALTQELNAIRSEKEVLASSNASLTKEIASLKEVASVQNTEITDALTQLNSLKAEKDILASTNASLSAEISSLKEAATAENIAVNETLTQELNSLKAEKEALASSNANLSAELTSLKETATQAVSAPVVESLTEEQIAEIKAEKEHLSAELEAIKHELNIVTQTREEKIISLQNEIGTLQNQLVSLSNSLNLETEEKNQLGTQIEQLTNLVSEKEQQLAGMSNNNSDEEFVDKLMQQINFLSDQKNNFETLYHDSVAELNLTKANLASITQLVDGQKDSISGLEETNKHVKLAQTLVLQAKDKTEAKQAINELVREIDRCIALLSE